ncbi:MAG: transposase [Nitrospiraceae bacterium]|nr:transposase [Nitrospiraceae bacterium]
MAPHIHQAFSSLLVWFCGIYHRVEPRHLQSYSNEFVFRFNRRAYSLSAFSGLQELLSATQSLTLTTLAKPESQWKAFNVNLASVKSPASLFAAYSSSLMDKTTKQDNYQRQKCHRSHPSG